MRPDPSGHRAADYCGSALGGLGEVDEGPTGEVEHGLVVGLAPEVEEADGERVAAVAHGSPVIEDGVDDEAGGLHVGPQSAGASPGPESSFIKITGTEIQQAITELMVDAGGYAALDPATHSAMWYFNFRKASIYAGSNEIQRNIIAERLLGLPREKK